MNVSGESVLVQTQVLVHVKLCFFKKEHRIPHLLTYIRRIECISLISVILEGRVKETVLLVSQVDYI